MVSNKQSICPDCGGELKHYDTVRRIIRTKNRKTTYVRIKRLRCNRCGKLHRVLPDNMLPYKQYEMEVVRGVLDGFIFSDTLGFEDYPCEMTMKRWLDDKSHISQFIPTQVVFTNGHS